MSYLPTTQAWAVYNAVSNSLLPYSVRRRRRDAIAALVDLARDPNKPWSWWYGQGFRAVRIDVTISIGQARLIGVAQKSIAAKRKVRR